MLFEGRARGSVPIVKTSPDSVGVVRTDSGISTSPGKTEEEENEGRGAKKFGAVFIAETDDADRNGAKVDNELELGHGHSVQSG